MMRKVGAEGPRTLFPGQHRPSVYKHLTCQKAALRKVIPRPGRRDFVADDPQLRASKQRTFALPRTAKNPQNTLDSEAPAVEFRPATKPAPIARNFCEVRRLAPATFGTAQALITPPLPRRMQNPSCLQIRPTMISFSALCISRCTADMESPVTTRKRVGRTMEVSASASGETEMMNSSLSHGSAQIYQFPVGGRAALGGRRYGDARLPADHVSFPVNETICSGSWYHQEAIEEAKPTWDR